MLGADFDAVYKQTFGRTPEEEISLIKEKADMHNAALEAGTLKKRNDVARWAVQQLARATSLGRPAPGPLIELFARLLGVGTQPRAGKLRNKEAFRAAARHVAKDPDATPSAIARAINYDQKAQIKKWLLDPRFSKAVIQERSLLRLSIQMRSG